MKRIAHMGMPTLLEAPSLEESAALCASLGLSFVEINMNLPEYQTDRLDEASFWRARKQHGVYCTLHLCEDFNPCHFDPLLSSAYLETMRRAIRFAQRVQIPVINMHLPEGVHFKLPGRKIFLFEQYSDLYLERLHALRSLCEEEIADSGILVCIENTSGFAPYAREGIELLLESDAFALTFDIGHDHCAGGVDMDFYLGHIDKLSHMHLHGANRHACHLPFGEGDIELKSMLALRDKTGSRAVLEVKDERGLRQSVEWMQNGNQAN